jgi:hypothetical protein
MAKGKMANPGKITRRTSNPTSAGGTVIQMAGTKSTKTANQTVNRTATPKSGKK